MGPGDVSKSSILDAIDLCLGARRNVQFTDADFYNLNVEKPIPRHFASMVDATTS
jgi:putative ATP-dependent endonuclease of OLD family